jgi:hypothetical protein
MRRSSAEGHLQTFQVSVKKTVCHTREARNALCALVVPQSVLLSERVTDTATHIHKRLKKNLNAQ